MPGRSLRLDDAAACFTKSVECSSDVVARNTPRGKPRRMHADALY
jgi:hypothetical protein